MKDKLCYLVDIIENNEDCVVLKVKDNKEMELIKLGYFDGNERLIRLTKGKNHTCTIFYNDNRKSLSWNWGESGFTLVSDNVTKMGELIESCITDDFDIYIGDDDAKIRESLHIKSLEDSKNNQHFIKIMYFKGDKDVVVHKDDEFYRGFSDINTAIKHFQDLNYDLDYRNEYIAETGCVVAEYIIQRNPNLLKWKEDPYYLQITDINDLNDADSFTVARVINGVNCVELHYNEGEATVEYGTRIKDDEWENEIEEVDWFNMNMPEEKLMKKLCALFEEKYDISINSNNETECEVMMTI